MAPIPFKLIHAVRQLRQHNPYYIARDGLLSDLRFGPSPGRGEVVVHSTDPTDGFCDPLQLVFIGEVSSKSYPNPTGSYTAGPDKIYANEDVTSAKIKIALQLATDKTIQDFLANDWAKTLANIDAIQRLAVEGSNVKVTRRTSPVKTFGDQVTVFTQHSLVIVSLIFSFNFIHLTIWSQIAPSSGSRRC